MIFLFIACLLLLMWKLISLAVKLTFGIVKTVLCVIGLPVLLIVLLVAGFLWLAFPLLLVGLIVAFLFSAWKKA